MDMSIDARYKAMNRERETMETRRQATAPRKGLLKPVLALMILAALGVAVWYFWFGGDKSEFLDGLVGARGAPRPPGKVMVVPSDPVK